MAQVIMDHAVSRCFGTSLAPIDMSITHLLGWTFSHQRAAQRATLEPFGWKATSQESL